MALDLSVLKPTPALNCRAILTIHALAPLSMVTKLPGKYYPAQAEPTEAMVLGMLENALGWHICDSERKQLIKRLEKTHKTPAHYTDVKFASLLQWHVRFRAKKVPAVMAYDDLWAQHLRGSSFPDGSRNYDRDLIPLMDAKRGGRVTISDRAEAKKDEDKVWNFEENDNIHLSAVRSRFPQYYPSPTKRGYVVPRGPYQYRLETSPELGALLMQALENPCSPLYLGSSDGWVDAEWQEVP